MSSVAVTVGSLSNLQETIPKFGYKEFEFVNQIPELTGFQLERTNSSRQEWLFFLRKDAIFDPSVVRTVLNKLQNHTNQSYVGYFNPKTRYLLICVRG